MNGRTKPKTMKTAIGIAPPIPFNVRPNENVLPRSAGFEVMALGRLQKGTSAIV